MAVLRWILALPIIIGVILFAVGNPQQVEVTWSPFHDPIQARLYFIVLMFLGIGFLLGAFIAWINFIPVLQERRTQRKTIRKLEQDVNSCNQKLIDELSRGRKDSYDNFEALEHQKTYDKDE
jgi:uncharacterized membrane protein YciS (DUF1049 family)